MIDRTHDLLVSRQAAVLGISRGSVYHLPRAVSDAQIAAHAPHAPIEDWRHDVQQRREAIDRYGRLGALWRDDCQSACKVGSDSISLPVLGHLTLPRR